MAVNIRKAKKDLQSDSKARVQSYEPRKLLHRSVKDYTKLPVSKLSTTIREGLKVVEFSAVVKSENPSRKGKDTKPAYKVTIQFNQIQFTETQDKFFSEPYTRNNGDRVYYNKPTFLKNDVKLKCQCADFRHKFETQLAKKGGLIGAPRKYTRKTPDWTKKAQADYEAGEGPYPYPFANPTNKLGYCKHVHTLSIYLKSKGLVKER